MTNRGIFTLTEDIMAWSDRFGHSRDPFRCAAKLAEEAGEALGEALKRDEQRQDGKDRTALLRDELGDVGIAWLKLCHLEGVEPLDVVWDRMAYNNRRPASERTQS